MEFIATTLAYLGVSPPDLFAGFWGSVVYVARPNGGTRAETVMLTMLANTLTANYLGSAMSMYVGAAGHVGAFLVGYFGLSVVKRIAPALFDNHKNGEASA